MKTEIGEYIVGAYLQMFGGCDVVSYNVRPRGGGREGLGELDVVGLNFKSRTAYLCEVTTHITGLIYRDAASTEKKLQDKHKRQKEYAEKYLSDFPTKRFMFWSPVVSPGILRRIRKVKGLDIIVNKDYTDHIEELRGVARKTTHDTSNPFFRALQILEHLKR